MNGRGSPTVFVDRDGVINANRADHVRSWLEVEFLPGALAGLALLTRSGFDVVVVTNQAIVNRGEAPRAAVDAIHARMVAEITRHGGAIRAVQVCPHRPDEGCGCRKPAPGLLLDAAARYGFDLLDAILVGDHEHDLEAARRANCSSILVLSGRIREWPSGPLPAGCLAVLPGLLDAAQFIVDPVRLRAGGPMLIDSR